MGKGEGRTVDEGYSRDRRSKTRPSIEMRVVLSGWYKVMHVVVLLVKKINQY
jgi:hypothetical protein